MLDMGQTWWTTEQVMEFLGVDRQAIYDSRARGKFPGNRGHRRGKRLMFPSDEIEEGWALVEAGDDPDPIEETADVALATLWQLQAIHKTLRAIHNELRAHRTLTKYTSDGWQIQRGPVTYYDHEESEEE